MTTTPWRTVTSIQVCHTGEARTYREKGCPIRNPNASERIGGQLRGTLMLQDFNLLDIISHITHERIPERYENQALR
jgi:catalase